MSRRLLGVAIACAALLFSTGSALADEPVSLSGVVRDGGGAVLAGVSVVVQHADSLPTMLEHADVVVQEVEGMVNLLREMVGMLFSQ